MKVIGICDSPRKGSNSEILLREVLEIIKKYGAKTELILLRNKNIKLCDGCQKCEIDGNCRIKDDMQKIYKKILTSNAIIFATPVYWNNVTPQMKNFINRMNPIGYKIKGKRLGVILVGSCKGKEKKESHEPVVNWFKGLNTLYETNFVGVIDITACKAEEVLKNKEAIRKAKKFGIKIFNDYKMEV